MTRFSVSRDAWSLGRATAAMLAGCVRRTLVVLALFGIAVGGFVAVDSAAAQVQPAQVPGTGFVERIFKDEAGEHRYTVYVPKTPPYGRGAPAILFLHGAGERGTDGLKPTTVGLGPAIRTIGDRFPYIAVFPQCEDLHGRILKGWSADGPDARRAVAILDDVEKRYGTDPKRRVLMGWSMGGYGVWSVAAAQPEMWSAAVPISGGAGDADVTNLKSVPVWSIAGEEDSIVPAGVSHEAVAKLRAAGGQPRETEVAKAGHDVWREALASQDLYDWIASPTPGTEEPVSLGTRSATAGVPVTAIEEPFVPAVDMPGAVRLRLGNEFLAQVSQAIPSKIPPDALTGGVADIYDATSTQGRTFQVVFSRIGYRATVGEVLVKSQGKDRLLVQLGLRNAVMTIGATFVSGAGRSASAGPINVVIGSQRPEWLSLVVTPFVENRRIRLRLVSSAFQIAPDNFYVSGPAGVSVQGLGMTEERVSSGLVSGLYGARGRIEQQVSSVVPKVVARLEEGLDLTKFAASLDEVWPLPVYRPRVRPWAQAIHLDEQGLTLDLGLTAAAIDTAAAPAHPRQTAPPATGGGAKFDGSGLAVGVSPGLLEPLTQLLVDEDRARIHVEDIPGGSFSRYADPETFARIVPDARRLEGKVDWRTELVLAEPLSVKLLESPAEPAATDGAATAGSAANASGEPKPSTIRLGLSAPKVRIAVSYRTREPRGNWTPYVELDHALMQPARMTASAPSHRRRLLDLAWDGGAQIETQGRFAPGAGEENKSIDAAASTELFAQAWQAWTGKGAGRRIVLKDLDVGGEKLRLAGLAPRGGFVVGTFGAASTKITNNSTEELVYEIRTPTSRWGGPHRLEPGKSHQYYVPYPLVYRRQFDGQLRMYTLAPGTHLEFTVRDEKTGPGLYTVKEPSIEELTGGK